MFILGVILGLLTALAASIAYLCSRAYTLSRDGGVIRLLAVSHVMQAVVVAPLAVILWPPDMPPVAQWVLPTVGAALCYVFGQGMLFGALRYTQASRLSPLLGLKVGVLALAAVLMLGEEVTWLQWIAVLITIAAAFILNYSGGSIPWPAIGLMAGVLIGYAMSDIYILKSILAMQPVAPLRAGVLSLCIGYLVLGLISLPLLAKVGSSDRRDWIDAVPYSLSWLASMFFIYTCFAALGGVVLGNILQSTRGVMSVGLGLLLASWGMVHLEPTVSREVFWRRLGAATLMCAAIALFMLG